MDATAAVVAAAATNRMAWLRHGTAPSQRLCETPRAALREPKVSVTRMRMLDKGTAQIDWAAAGGLGVFGDVAFAATTVVELNLLTGRVTSLK